MIVSTTIASVIEFAGNATTPLTLMFVVVIEVAINFVAVALVKTPVLGVVAPIGLLLMVPPEIVSASTTLLSVILFTGKVTVPKAVRLPKNALVDETLVPVAEVKLSGPASVPPASGR